MTAGVEVIGSENLQRFIAGRSVAIVGAMRGAILASVIALSAKVKDEKLSGQVLKTRTGRLRRSINHKTSEAGDVLTGTVGTNVEYARRHEFGGTFDEQVRAHMRTCRQVFGQQLRAPIRVSVRAHPRHVVLPERSFLRSAFTESLPGIQARMENAIKEAVNGAGS